MLFGLFYLQLNYAPNSFRILSLALLISFRFQPCNDLCKLDLWRLYQMSCFSCAYRVSYRNANLPYDIYFRLKISSFLITFKTTISIRLTFNSKEQAENIQKYFISYQHPKWNVSFLMYFILMYNNLKHHERSITFCMRCGSMRDIRT